jgi:inositol-1,3,4-trisphosphate 5/6-kinase/inositol-tetrakisphosphate 1-kinase
VVHFDSQILPKSFETEIQLANDLDRVFLRSDPNDIHLQKETILKESLLQRIAESLHKQLVKCWEIVPRKSFTKLLLGSYFLWF